MGRLRVYLEPRDIWVGIYVAPRAVYVCPLPLLVFRWQRRRKRASFGDPWLENLAHASERAAKSTASGTKRKD